MRRESVRHGALVLLGIAAVGCRGDDEVVDTGAEVTGCRAGEGPAERVAMVSHPYASDDTTWEVLSVDPDGALASTGTTFSLGRATGGEVVFTPDGSIGLVALEDGVLGVVAVTDGAVEVVESAWSGANGDLYVSGVAMHPSGETALVLDPNWRKNGGQVVEVAIDCDSGALTETGRAWPSKLAQAAVAFGVDEWLVAADDLGGSETGDVHRLGDEVTTTGRVFPDADAIVSSMALYDDLVVLADFNAFAGGNRLGVGRVTADGIATLGGVDGVEDPVDIAFAPDGTSAVVASGFGDALIALSVDLAHPSRPVQLLGELAYDGGRPALPASIAEVPALSMAYVAENVGVRPVRFRPGGEIVDLGRFEVGTGTESVVGAIGVQP